MAGQGNQDIEQRRDHLQQMIGPTPEVKVGPYSNKSGTQIRQQLLIVEVCLLICYVLHH